MLPYLRPLPLNNEIRSVRYLGQLTGHPSLSFHRSGRSFQKTSPTIAAPRSDAQILYKSEYPMGEHLQSAASTNRS